MLFWLDHNVSALMASARKFPVNRPSGANWDFFLLGCTTFVAGLIGLPGMSSNKQHKLTNADISYST